MKILFHPDVNKHPGNSYENASRLNDFQDLPTTNIDRQSAIDAIDRLYSTNRLNIGRVFSMAKNSSRIAETQLSPESYDSILASVSLALQASRSGDFALTRPPGHHANRFISRGFCILNNIAIAVNQLIIENKKVAIIDIDGHHGNGTEDIFATNEKVFYTSLHQQGSYPNTKNRKSKQSPQIFSIALPEESGDDIFKLAAKEMLKRIVAFSPDIIAVSAGFDGHHTDPLLNLKFTEHAYHYFGQELAKLKIPSFAVLEGGYHGHLRACIEAFVDGFNGAPHNFQEQTTTSTPALLNRINIFP